MKPPITKYNTGWLQLSISVGHSTAKLTRALKRDGWMQMMPRLWVRPFVKFATRAEHIDAIRDAVPCAANLRFIYITDAQWGNSVTVSGPNYPRTVAKVAA